MGALLCCFRVPDSGEEQTNNDYLFRKWEELLRDHTRRLTPEADQPIPSSDDPSQKSMIFTSQTIDGYLHDLSEDEDVCPICLEDYTDQNPRICLQCGHEFHLGCIYDWMERSAACPFCDKMMLFEEAP